MSHHSNQLQIPFPVDVQQAQIMQGVIEAGGHAIASDGGDRFELFSRMVEGGYMAMHHCPQAGDVHQFSVTGKGRAAVRQHMRAVMPCADIYAVGRTITIDGQEREYIGPCDTGGVDLKLKQGDKPCSY